MAFGCGAGGVVAAVGYRDVVVADRGDAWSIRVGLVGHGAGDCRGCGGYRCVAGARAHAGMERELAEGRSVSGGGRRFGAQVRAGMG